MILVKLLVKFPYRKEAAAFQGEMMLIRSTEATLLKSRVPDKQLPAPARKPTTPTLSTISELFVEEDDRHMPIARGIAFAVLISLPLWFILGLAILLLL
jgi:hypothetical protein